MIALDGMTVINRMDNPRYNPGTPCETYVCRNAVSIPGLDDDDRGGPDDDESGGFCVDDDIDTEVVLGVVVMWVDLLMASSKGVLMCVLKWVLMGVLTGALMCCSCVCVLRTSKGCVMSAANTPVSNRCVERVR